LGLVLSIVSLNIILKDYKSNKFIQKNSNTVLFSLFFFSCILASIINGNGFQRFNNIYFIIHSVLFFFVIITINKEVMEYRKITNIIILIILSTLSLISLITILIYFSNKLGITDTFKSDSLKNNFHYVVPFNRRWNTILINPNTYAHLVSMSFFLSLIPLITIKKNWMKILIIIMTILNIVTTIFSGCKGAIVAILAGSFLLFVHLLIFLKKSKKRKTLLMILGVLLLIPITFIILYKANNEKIIKASNLLIDTIFRVDSKGNGRVIIWKELLNMDLFPNLWGYNDSYIYDFFKNSNNWYSWAFINNCGRAHNMIIQIIVSFGSISFVLFITCLIRTVVQYFKSTKKIANENKLYVYIFAIQFVTILVGGMFEQLPIFNLSPHSLLFMFVWANLLTLTETSK
jgi:O-antigen ligase